MASSHDELPKEENPLAKFIAVKYKEWQQTEASFIDGMKSLVARSEVVYPKLTAQQQRDLDMFLIPYRELSRSQLFLQNIDVTGKTPEEVARVYAQALADDMKSPAFTKHVETIKQCVMSNAEFQNFMIPVYEQEQADFQKALQSMTDAQKMQQKVVTGFNYEIIKTMQRLPRYELYLSEIKKETKDATNIPVEITTLIDQYEPFKANIMSFNANKSEWEANSKWHLSTEVMGEISKQIRIQNQAISSGSVKLSEEEKSLWNNFSNDVRRISQTLQEHNKTDNRLPDVIAEQFYGTFMRTFIDGYLLHEQGQKDLLSSVMRPLFVNIDNGLIELDLEGIVFKTRDKMPGSTHKDEAALSTLNTAEEYSQKELDKVREKLRQPNVQADRVVKAQSEALEQKLVTRIENFIKVREDLVNDLFDKTKTLLASNAKSNQEIIYQRAVLAVPIMGDKAMKIWNDRAAKEFAELAIPESGKKTETFSQLSVLEKDEITRRESLITIVINSFNDMQQKHPDVIPAGVKDKLFSALNEANKPEYSREDVRQNVQAALAAVYTDAYLADRTKGMVASAKGKYLTAIEEFLVNVDTKMDSRKQKRFFTAPDGATLVAGNARNEQVVFESIANLRKEQFNNYVQNLFETAKGTLSSYENGLIDKSKAESIHVNAFKILERMGSDQAKSDWTRLATIDPDKNIAGKLFIDSTKKIEENNTKQGFNNIIWEVNGNTLINIIKEKLAVLDKKHLPAGVEDKLNNLLNEASKIEDNAVKKEAVREALIIVYMDAYLVDRSKSNKITVRGDYLKTIESLLDAVEKAHHERNLDAGVFTDKKTPDLGLRDKEHTTAAIIFGKTTPTDLSQSNVKNIVRALYTQLKVHLAENAKPEGKNDLRQFYANAQKALERLGTRAKGEWEVILKLDQNTMAPEVAGLMKPIKGENAALQAFDKVHKTSPTNSSGGIFGLFGKKTPSPPNSPSPRPSASVASEKGDFSSPKSGPAHPDESQSQRKKSL